MPGTFYREESMTVCNDLPTLLPGLLYLFPQYGSFGTQSFLEAFVSRTATEIGDSGGKPAERVRGEGMKGHRHLVPIKAPDVSAEVVAKHWIELQSWHRRRKIAKDGDGKSANDGTVLSEEWKTQVKQWYKDTTPRRR